jgi:nitroreductase
MDIFETISKRISIRSYHSEPASATDLEAIRLVGEKAEALTPLEMRFLLCTEEQMGKEIKGIIGDYGRTIIAPNYLVLAAREGDGYLTDAGFRFEQAVLEATRRGLGTCWVGLMFKEASLRATLGLDAGWRMMVISPLGLPADPGFASRVLRALAGSPQRKPFDQLFFWQQHGTPLPPVILNNERLSLLLEATRRAPSWMNRQPWYFLFTGKEVLVYKRKRQDREGKDYHRLDCGIAMCHFHLAAKTLGIGSRWELGTFEIPGEPGAEPIGRYLMELGKS